MQIKKYTEYCEPEILNLYNSVGWTAYLKNAELLKTAFANSLSVLAAYEQDELQGIIRVVGDGCTLIYIQDLLVFPEYQHRGVGTALLQAILHEYRHVRQIVLLTDKTDKTVKFYRKSGLREVGDLNCLAFMKML